MDIMQEYEDKKRLAIAEIARNHTDQTLEDLIELFDDEEAKALLMATPVHEIFGLKAPAKPRRKPGRRKASRKAGNGVSANTGGNNGTRRRSPPRVAGSPSEATAGIDAAVETFCRENPGCKASAILKKTGISKSQLRTSTNRLVAAGKITRLGKGRGVTYAALLQPSSPAPAAA